MGWHGMKSETGREEVGAEVKCADGPECSRNVGQGGRVERLAVRTQTQLKKAG